MKNTEAYARLVEKDIKPSVQRIVILDYLMTNNIHPSVETVYHALVKRIPTLSATTVYNTLRLFAEKGVANMITIDEHHVCYDGFLKPHAHFLCRKCGKVFDIFDTPMPSLKAGTTIEGHRPDHVQLYYRGLCSECSTTET